MGQISIYLLGKENSYFLGQNFNLMDKEREKKLNTINQKKKKEKREIRKMKLAK